jgi:GNAT superfamily N-acetyltransferase
MQQVNRAMVRTLRVRTAQSNDLPRLNDIAARAVETLSSPYFTVEQVRAALEAKIYELDTELVEAGTYYVAEIDGVVVAGSGWSTSGQLDSIVGRGAEASGTAAMRSTYVEPGWSRLGIASLLARATETAASLSGFHRFETMCTPMAAAMRRALGYETVADAQVPYGPGLLLDLVVMRKEAGASPQHISVPHP